MNQKMWKIRNLPNQQVLHFEIFATWKTGSNIYLFRNLKIKKYLKIKFAVLTKESVFYERCPFVTPLSPVIQIHE